ncbi:MAG: radical SAM family heme chaperone HemW [Bacteroidales bacterium]
MAGIYLHIPFCKKKCHYCDFYKTLETGKTGSFLKALKKEIELRKGYLEKEGIETVYFGGGTPSVLSVSELGNILETISIHFDVADGAEITVELNPDDINKTYADELKKSAVNRISLGIQSWDNNILKMLNRRHTAAQAGEAIRLIHQAGIDNISADLLYGIPGMSSETWVSGLKKTLDYDIKHLSAYHLTIEEGTVFGRMKEAGELQETDEEESERQFAVLLEICSRNDFIQYEISNFCKEGYYSKHNTNYWRRVPYLGLGPSAHSFNGETRQWNVAGLTEYIKYIERGEVPATVETLGLRDRYNEYIMTSLRTMWGADLDYVEENINKELRDYLSNLSTRFIRYGMMKKKDNTLILTDQGKMISDNIISSLMMA